LIKIITYQVRIYPSISNMEKTIFNKKLTTDDAFKS
jgi:hypothetical protein